MDKIVELLTNIWSLSTDQIAIISLLITLLIFVIGKLSENRLKKFEIRKAEYQKLIDFFQDMFSNVDIKDATKLTESKNFKQKFIAMGASAAIYGSKKLYSTYIFYRILALDENVQKTRWYSSDMILYSLGEMYKIMRKEIGLNHDLIPFDVPDMLSFYISDFIKPEFKKKFYQYHFNKFAIKSAIVWGKIEKLIPLVWLQNYIIKPFFLLCFCIIRFPFKLLIITPIKIIKNRKQQSE
ncbi:MAG: hypothetical protein HFE49_00590 [Clostridia bacterium]|nr:hypothetical protein [Clostridia bacterium]